MGYKTKLYISMCALIVLAAVAQSYMGWGVIFGYAIGFAFSELLERALK